MPQLTGLDFIIGMADQAVQRNQPYAAEFLMMAQQAALGRGQLITEVQAVRPLREEEASPVSIVLGAYEAARQDGDAESLQEVLQVGMALLTKWATYLAVMEQHPSLSLGGVEDS